MTMGSTGRQTSGENLLNLPRCGGNSKARVRICTEQHTYLLVYVPLVRNYEKKSASVDENGDSGREKGCLFVEGTLGQ